MKFTTTISALLAATAIGASHAPASSAGKAISDTKGAIHKLRSVSGNYVSGMKAIAAGMHGAAAAQAIEQATQKVQSETQKTVGVLQDLLEELEHAG